MLEQVTEAKHEIVCRNCRQAAPVSASYDEVRRWLETPRSERPFVQDAFPDMPKEERELLLSGTCGTCWTKMFGVDCD